MTNRPKYVDPLLSHLRRSPVEPGLHHIEVRHADDCRIFEGETCNCEPEIETGARIDQKYGGEG